MEEAEFFTAGITSPPQMHFGKEVAVILYLNSHSDHLTAQKQW